MAAKPPAKGARPKAAKAAPEPEKIKAGDVLNERQKRFCDEYIIDFNASAAYLRAGFQCKPSIASSAACQLMANPLVQARIGERLKEAAYRAEISVDRVLRELKDIGFLDIGEAFNDDGSLKSIKEMPEGVRRAISGLEVEDIYEGYGKDRVWVGKLKKIKLIEKTKSLELIGRYLKMWAEHVKEKTAEDDPLVTMLKKIAEGQRSRLQPGQTLQ